MEFTNQTKSNQTKSNQTKQPPPKHQERDNICKLTKHYQRRRQKEKEKENVLMVYLCDQSLPV